MALPRRVKWMIGGFLGIAAIGGLTSRRVPDSGVDPSTKAAAPIEQPAPKPKRENASATVACDEFKKVLSGIADGTSTPAELREMLKAVREDAHLAELHDADVAAPPEGFQDQAIIMLRTITQDQGPEFINAVAKFNHMCQGL